MVKGRNYNNKEWDQLKKLKDQNKKLKRENDQLRKLLDKANNYDKVLEITKKKKEEEKKAKDIEKWKCFECDRGHMSIKRIYQANGVFYIRMCSNQACDYKTKKKKWTSDVKGLENE